MNKEKEIKNGYKYGLIIVLAISFMNCVTGYYWGLTSVFEADEGKLVEPLRRMVESKVLLHGVWAYPTQFSSKILAIFLIFLNKFYTMEPIQYYYANRIWCAVLAAGAVYLTWLIIRKIKGDRFAFAMSILMAICPLWAKYAKEVTGDIPAFFFSLLVLYMAQHYVDSRKKQYLILMGIFAACSALEKWHGAWTCFFIAIVVLLLNYKNIVAFFQDGIIAAASFFTGLVLLAPNLIIDFSGIVTGIGFTYVYDGTIENPLLLAYPQYFFTHVGVLAVIALGVGGYNVFFNTKDSESLDYYVIYLFSPACIVAFWFIMIRTTFERWGCGVYWGLLLLLLDGIFCMIKSCRRNYRILGVIILTLVVACFVSESIMINLIATNTHKDGRIVGEKVLENLGATNDNTLSDYYTTFAPGGMRVEGAGQPIEFQECGSNFAVEKNSVPYMVVPNIKYVVIGGYILSDKNSDGYEVVKKYGKLVDKIDSVNTDLCIFAQAAGSGNWLMMEVDIIRRNINNCKLIINSDVIGPSFSVYDVSEFKYMEQ